MNAASDTQAPLLGPWTSDLGAPVLAPEAAAAPAATATAATVPISAEANVAQLRHRREELAGQIAELHWNLGGLAYEMAIRDHFRLDVLLRRAAMLQEREIELNELDRLLGKGA